MGSFVKLTAGIALITLISWTSAELHDPSAADLGSTPSPDHDPITTETPIKGCKEVPRMNPEEPLYFEQISGLWYAIRVGPPCEEMEGVLDCLTELYWSTGDTAKNEFSYLVRYRLNGTYVSSPGIGRLTRVPSAEKIDPLIIYGAFEGMSDLPCTLMGTDKGRSWLVWACCVEIKEKTRTVWSIMSRVPTMDAKLEQTLVEYVEAHGKVPRAQLAGVGHTKCYGTSESDLKSQKNNTAV